MAVSVEKISRSDLEGGDYLEHPLPLSELVKHLESWMREALVAPFDYQGEISPTSRFESFGQSLVEISQRAVEARSGSPGYERAKAELVGVEKLETLLAQEGSVGDVAILLSPPGTSEEGFGTNGQRRLSFTYVFFVNSGPNEEGKSIRTVALPTKEISAEDHIRIFKEKFGDIASISLMPDSLCNRLDQALVAQPILLTNLDDQFLAKLDGFSKDFSGKSWTEVNIAIENGLKLSGDSLAEGRRKTLIGSIAWEIRRYVDEKDGNRLVNIGEAARIVMAREAGGHYLGWTSDELLDEYHKTESSMWLQRKLTEASAIDKAKLIIEHGAEIAIAKIHLFGVMNALRRDKNVSEILFASSCGGGGYGSVLESFSGRWDMTQKNNILQTAFDATQSTSTETSSKMECVKCPFCHKTVDAIVTSTKIKCPECKAEVSTGGA